MRQESIARSVSLLAAAVFVLVLSGCSNAVERPFPTLAGIKKFGDEILTKSETEQAIKDLNAEQKKQQEEAAKRVKAP